MVNYDYEFTQIWAMFGDIADLESWRIPLVPLELAGCLRVLRPLRATLSVGEGLRTSNFSSVFDTVQERSYEK